MPWERQVALPVLENPRPAVTLDSNRGGIEEGNQFRDHPIRIFMSNLAGANCPMPSTTVTQHQAADVGLR